MSRIVHRRGCIGQSTLLFPEAGPLEIGSLAELQRVSTNQENALRIERTSYTIDVREEARSLDIPTLVLHSRSDAMIPFSEGRELAALIQGAEWVPLDSRNHVLLASGPAWPVFLDAVRGFLGVRASEPEMEPAGRFRALTERERDVLDSVARGLSNDELRGYNPLAAETVHAQNPLFPVRSPGVRRLSGRVPVRHPFVGGFLVPRTVDAGGPIGSPLVAVVVNAAVLLLFALQHSVMARPGFKRWWTQFVPKPIERSTYVLLASLALVLVFVAWRPMPAILWDVEQAGIRAVLWTLFGIGWATVFLSTVMIGHADLFGIAQVWREFRGARAPSDRFRVPGLYRLVRHPIMTGFLIAFWATPTMTFGHLLFAVATTGYILLGVWLEERDLVGRFGTAYAAYRQRTPAFFPRIGRGRENVTATGRPEEAAAVE